LGKRGNKGVSTVLGGILFFILVITLVATLFLGLFRFNETTQEALAIEEMRAQERIVLVALTNDTLGEYVTGVLVNNTGAASVRIRAVYVDNVFICDPSDPSINPSDTYINIKDYRWIQLPNGIEYQPTSKIAVATERGIKAVEYEWKLKTGALDEPPSETERFHFGPLLLNFDKFYYTECDASGNYDPYSWKPGWSVEGGIGSIVWNITVTNIDDRNITITQYSCLTLVPNDGPNVQKPFYMEPPGGNTMRIDSNQTVSIIYIWDTPRTTQTNTQSIYNQNCRNKVFLTFFGVFHEHDGTTKPYGQTIPFEAVLVRPPQMEISADPTAIAIDSSMTSTITATVRTLYGDPAVNVPVTFTTTLGTVTPSTVNTDSSGIALTILSPGTEVGTATITASWGEITKSTTVTINEGTLTVTANPEFVAANSTMTSTVSALVQLNGIPISGEQVTFAMTPNNLGTLPTQATTDTQGYATVTFTPGTETGSVTITAIWGMQSSTTTITIESATVTISKSADPIAVGSSMTSAITAHVQIGSKPEGNVEVAFTLVGEGILSSSLATTNSTGDATVTLSPGLIIGSANIITTWQGKSANTTVNIVSASVTTTADPSIIPAGATATSTITAQVLFNGTPVAADQVTFSTNLGEVTPNSAITDSNGYVTATFTAGSTAGIATITATWEGVSGSTDLTIALGKVTLSVTPSQAVNGSTTTFTIAATVELGGVLQPNEQVDFTTSFGTLSAISAQTDSNGTATVTLEAGPILSPITVTVSWWGITEIATINVV
jgi:hypothetical protein